MGSYKPFRGVVDFLLWENATWLPAPRISRTLHGRQRRRLRRRPAHRFSSTVSRQPRPAGLPGGLPAGSPAACTRARLPRDHAAEPAACTPGLSRLCNRSQPCCLHPRPAPGAVMRRAILARPRRQGLARRGRPSALLGSLSPWPRASEALTSTCQAGVLGVPVGRASASASSASLLSQPCSRQPPGQTGPRPLPVQCV